jgi:hypothetical protein
VANNRVFFYSQQAVVILYQKLLDI